MIEAFDNSMLSNYKRCPRYFLHRHVEGLVTRDEDDVANSYKTQFGSAWHLAMDEWFRTGDTSLSDKAFINHYLPYEGQCIKGLRTIANGLYWLEKYRKNYPLEEEPFKIISIETGFAVEVDKFVYCGRVDKLVRWTRGQTGLMVIDHKTSAAKGFLTIRPNAAIDGYIWGVTQILKEPIESFMLDQLYMYKTKYKLIREVTFRSEYELVQWQNDTKLWVEGIRRCEKSNNWPRNTNSCMNFGRECEYMPLCKNARAINTDNLKADLFLINHWVPYPE